MSAGQDPFRIAFEQPCDVFLHDKDGDNGNLNWRMELCNGQRVTMQLPLDPLLASLEIAAENGKLPHEVSRHMRDVIRDIAEHHTVCTTQTIDRAVLLKMMETLPWIDYGEVFKKIEERGRAEGRAERDREIAALLDGRGGAATPKNTVRVEDDGFPTLVKRIEEAFFEIDGDVCNDLRDTDGEYIEMHREIMSLQKDFPVIPQITEGNGAVSVSAEEHKALVRYLGIKNEMENSERRQIYFQGHTDGFAYLKKIGAV